jgi:hypothetical protein
MIIDGVTVGLQIGQRVKVLEPFRPIRFGRIIEVDQDRLPVFSLCKVEIESRIRTPEDPAVESQTQAQATAWVAVRHCRSIDPSDTN